MEGSKIHLSQPEIDLVCNTDIILTKNTIIKKAITMFEELQETMVESNKKISNADDIFSVSPKISKGENYSGLPYVVLDYPRMSNGDNLCFIRTMFWWGNFFSNTLQLSGMYKERYIEQISSDYHSLSNGHYFIGINTDPWHHHFEETNYREIRSVSSKAFETILHEQAHIKIAAKWPLTEWNNAATTLYKSWNFLAGLVS